MMKQFKKSALVTTAAFLLCLTVASGTLNLISLPSVTIETEGDAEPTPLPAEPEIKPMADENEGNNRIKNQ